VIVLGFNPECLQFESYSFRGVDIAKILPVSPMIKHWGLALLVAAILTKVRGQEYDTPNSSPHSYPGQPQGDFSPEWQKCELRPNFIGFHQRTISFRLPGDRQLTVCKF